MRIEQAPREGIYAAINRCIERATGKFVYIATSDDTMAENCLETLVVALEDNPACAMAHCPLIVLSADGQTLDFAWERVSVFARSSHGLLSEPHIRHAPYNGVLHLGGETVFNSLTQLLIRRDAFDAVGLFRDDWGSMSDFHWGMRAGLLLSSVHAPGTWAGWRVHPAQATRIPAPGATPQREKLEEMIDAAIAAASAASSERTLRLLRKYRQYFSKRWNFDQGRSSRRNPWRRLAFVLSQCVIEPVLGAEYLLRRLRGLRGWELPPVEVVKRWLTTEQRSPIEAARKSETAAVL